MFVTKVRFYLSIEHQGYICRNKLIKSFIFHVNMAELLDLVPGQILETEYRRAGHHLPSTGRMGLAACRQQVFSIYFQAVLLESPAQSPALYLLT